MIYAKLAPLFLLALFIDGAQWFIAFSLDVAMTFPGTLLGAGAGSNAGYVLCGVVGSAAANICSWVGGGLFAAIGTLPFINTPLATIAEPIGIALGFAIGICLSFTLGSILLMFLFLAGVLDKKAAILTILGETIPGFDMLPSWTALVGRCVWTAYKESAKRSAIGNMASVSQSFLLPNSAAGAAVGQGNFAGMAEGMLLTSAITKLSEEEKENYRTMEEQAMMGFNTTVTESAERVRAQSPKFQDIRRGTYGTQPSV